MRKTLFLGTILFLIALGLRLLPLNYGLPNTFYYDEGRYVSQAVRVGSDGIRPASYTYGPLFPYAVAGSYGFVYSIGKASGQWLDSKEFQEQYFKDPSLFFGTARALSALFGALAATLLLTTGRRWLRLETGRVANSWENFLEPLKSSANLGPWLAAFSLAVFATAVSFGAQAKAESLLLLLIVLWLYGVGRYRQGSSLAILSFAGICLGLATATKYNAILFLPWHALVPFLGARFRKGSTWSATLLAPVGGFFLGAPASILDLQGLWQGIQFNSKISTGFSFADPTLLANKMQSFAFEDLQGGLGPLLFLFALMGTWSVLRNRGRSGLWLVSLAWGFLAFHLFQDAPRLVPRYLLPAIPVFFILAGAGIDSVLGATVHRFGSPPAFLRVATVVLLLLPTLIGTVSWVTPVLGDDTRWQAQVWIEKNIPSQSAVLVEDPVASPPLNPTGAAVARDPRGARRAGELAKGNPSYRLFWLPAAWGMANTEKATEAAESLGYRVPGFSNQDMQKLSLSYWRERGLRYVVVSSAVYNRHLEDRVDAVPAYKTFYETLFRRGKLIYKSEPSRFRAGPTIRVYDIGQVTP